MSYTPTVWNKGDIITVAKLNKIENGISNSIQLPENAFIINCTYNSDEYNYEIDKTWTEIITAYESGKKIFAVVDNIGTLPMDVYGTSPEDAQLFHTSTALVNGFDFINSTFVISEVESSDVAEGYYATTVAHTATYLAQDPPTNGTYVLKATKTNSGITYAWVAE